MPGQDRSRNRVGSVPEFAHADVAPFDHGALVVLLERNVAGGVAWVFSMVLAGYFLGRTIPDVEKHVHGSSPR